MTTDKTSSPDPARTGDLTTRALLVLSLGVLLILAATGTGGLDALYAAGLAKGTAIPGLSDFFDKIKDNLFWLFGMVFVVGGIIAGIALSAAHSRGHDMLLRIGLGAAVVVAIPGVLA